MTKSELRQKMKELRNQLTKEERVRYAEELRQRLTGMELWVRSKQLFTYLSFGTEVDTRNMVEEALSGERGPVKQVYVPRVEGRNMCFYHLTEATLLEPSSFGVPEPVGNNLIPYRGRESESEAASPKLMLIPGLAFDLCGNRIGYGAGYYDRYLREHEGEHFVKVGLAYDFQLLERIPSEEQDIRMDYILTPERIIRCKDR